MRRPFGNGTERGRRREGRSHTEGRAACSAGGARRPPCSPLPLCRPWSGQPAGGRPMIPARIGVVTALVTLLLDQITKLYALFGYDLPVREPVRLTPFLDLIVVWNRGISYGLFQQHTEVGRWILVVVSLAAALALSVWIRRTEGRLLAACLGLIVGGAIGNAIDRVAFGAVFDF